MLTSVTESENGWPKHVYGISQLGGNRSSWLGCFTGIVMDEN